MSKPLTRIAWMIQNKDNPEEFLTGNGSGYKRYWKGFMFARIFSTHKAAVTSRSWAGKTQTADVVPVEIKLLKEVK